MSFPKKTNGWRFITVDQQRFRWRFQTGKKFSTLKLQGNLSSGQQVVITLEDWCAPWLSFPTKQVIQNSPRVITAKLVSEAIRFSRAQGWKPDEAQPPLLINFIDGVFVFDSEE